MKNGCLNVGKKIGVLFLSAMVPMMIFGIVFMGPKITQGNFTLLVSDLNGQYVNYFLYFKEAIEKGDSLFYSFSMLLGGDTLSMLGYYMLSPLNFLIYLWPSSKIASAIFIVIMIKIGLAGATSFLFFSRKRGIRIQSLLFSTTYALSGYVFAYFMHVMWLDALYMLPMVIMGLELLFEKRNKVLYIISLSFSITICYYTGYMIAGFCLIYFIYLQIIEKQKVRRRIDSIMTFAWSSILAAALSAVFLIPILLSQMGNRQAQEEINYGIMHSVREVISRFFSGSYNGEQFANGAPQVYCGITILFLLVISFFSVRKENTRKIISAIVLVLPLFLSFMVGKLDIIWHGMAMPNSFTHRYAFVFVFAMIVLVEEFFSDKTAKVSLAEVIATDVLIVFVAIIVLLTGFAWVNKSLLIFDIGCALVVSFTFWMYKKGLEARSYIALSILFLVQFLQIFVNSKEYIGIHAYDDHSTEGYFAAVKPIVEYIQESDTGFYRMEKMYSNSTNDAMMLSYNGLSHFSSADKHYIREFMGKLGYNKNYDFWVYYDKGATKAADSLLGVKYVLSTQPLEGYAEKARIGNQIIYENSLAMEIGTVCSSQITKVELSDGMPFFNQEKIYDAMLGKRSELFYFYDKPEVYVNNLTWGENAYVKVDGEKDGIISFEITAKDTNPIYMFLPSVYNPGLQVCVNGEDIGEYLTTYHRGMIKLGTFDEGEQVRVELYLHGLHAGFNDIRICSIDEEQLTVVARQLKKQGWNVREYNSSRVYAEFSVLEKDSVLLLTIPYNENWKIEVDGVSVSPIETVGALMAIEVPTGEHIIEMKYQPKGLALGGMVSLIALITLIIVIMVDKKTRKKSWKPQDSFFSYMVKALSFEDKENVNKKEETKEIADNKEIHKSEGESIERVFLERLYEGKCQVCSKQIKDKYDLVVWEAYSMFDYKNAGKKHPVAWDKICLCPICKAELSYGEVEMQYFLPAVIASVNEDEEMRKFKIQVCGETRSIFYVKDHLNHLQNALESEEGEQLMEMFRFKN